MELSKTNFYIIKDFVYTVSSIDLAENKMYLVEQRLEPLIKKYNYSGFDEFVMNLMTPDENFISEVISAMTTNETFFFRDSHIWESIKKVVVPKLAKMAKERSVRIWSAACSTGQEPYTIAMLIDEYISTHQYEGIRRENFTIMATDIDDEIMKKSKAGVYTNLEVSRGLPENYKRRYFTSSEEGWVTNWKVSDELKKMITFKRMSLTGHGIFPAANDFVFCRNVLIYFDLLTKKEIIEKIGRSMSPEGYLLLGSSESLFGISDTFKPDTVERATLYRLK